jgi:cytoskeletal protein CcmA (bactofilin family)
VKSTGRIVGTVRFGQLEVELGGVIKGDTGPLDEPIKDVQAIGEPKATVAE